MVHGLLLSLFYMANKLKSSSTKNPVDKPGKTKSANLKPEKEEKINLKELARDERTWKIVGFIFLFFSFFLLISFTSYFFTWREDQPDVLNKGISILFDNNIHVSNLLGKTGALASNFFINTAFGIASFLICTFFFVVGVNLLFNRKVFSIWRNLKYVTIGLLVLSVLLHFVLSGAGGFPYGGGVGKMISNWMIGVFGTIGTAAVLIVLALGYIIWQFNPAFKMPQRKKVTDVIKPENEIAEEKIVPLTGKTINEVYAENGANGNSLKTNGGSIVLSPVNTGNYQPEFKLIEKETNESAVEMAKEKTLSITPLEETTTLLPKEEIKPAKKTSKENSEAGIALEIKEFPKETVEEEETEKEKGYEDLPPYEPTLDLRDYRYPVLDLLETHGSEKIVQDANELENNKNQIIATLRNYDIEIQKIMATVGPTVTLYEIVPAAGIRISRIKNLEDDIALSLAALGIRIIAPIPGKGTIGIEVPNVRKSIVSMKTLLGSDKFQHNNYSLPIALGKKIDNDNFIVDLTSMPHLLMAGATGQGKSVGINAILVSLLYKKHPSQLKFVLIDPKKVELSLYRVIENHFLAKLPGEEEAIITDTKKVVHTLNALCIEMDNRYDLLKEAGARNIKEYNEKFVKRKLNPLKGHQFLPFIVLVIDEFADLIMTAGKEIEMPIARLAQLARAVGIHLIIATQRPSVNIITGTIKANFPSRIAFKVSSKIDSRTILDTGGAEQLIGKGDMLVSHHGEVTRLQCAFVDTPEVDKVVSHIEKQRGYPQAFLLPEYVDEKELESRDFDVNDKDPLFEDAARLIVQNQVGSTSLLQRRMKLGYNRAGRLMDQLESAGVVGPNQGSKARDVLIKTESDLNQHLANLI
ncbi:MAG TPA: DNA translocase FtsK 4TM domain-containing protein [Chitinophagaceae bacterium]|nr:DNA translocase FtsK 4TM domain-containing protein [Chitinophagaceae bacterium]